MQQVEGIGPRVQKPTRPGSCFSFQWRYNPQTMKHTLLKHTIQWFSMYSESCTTIINTNSRTFSSPLKRNSIFISSHSPFSAPLRLWQLLICSVPIDLPILNISHEWNHTLCSLSCPTFFFQVFKIFLIAFIFLFFNFTILYWFCHVSTWIRHRYTCVPHPEPSFLLPPRTIPLGRPSAPAPSIQYRASNLDWWLVSYMILYMFQCPPSFMLVLTFIHGVACKCIYSFLGLDNDTDIPRFVHLFLSWWTCGFQFLCWGYKWSGYEHWCTTFCVDGCFSILPG